MAQSEALGRKKRLRALPLGQMVSGPKQGNGDSRINFGQLTKSL